MGTRTQRVALTLVMYGSIVWLPACGTQQSDTNESDVMDVESAYFNLSKEAQTEVMGAQVKSSREMRKDLLLQADKNGDGVLSKDEKASLRAQWKELKEQIKMKLKAELDADQDGEISREEKKAGLDNMGQKIKTAIQDAHKEMRAAQKEARAKIKEACAEVRSHGPSSDKGENSEDEDLTASIKADLEQCKSVTKEEKDKLHAMMKDSLAALKQEIDELKDMLIKVETRNSSI